MLSTKIKKLTGCLFAAYLMTGPMAVSAVHAEETTAVSSGTDSGDGQYTEVDETSKPKITVTDGNISDGKASVTYKATCNVTEKPATDTVGTPINVNMRVEFNPGNAFSVSKITYNSGDSSVPTTDVTANNSAEQKITASSAATDVTTMNNISYLETGNLVGSSSTEGDSSKRELVIEGTVDLSKLSNPNFTATASVNKNNSKVDSAKAESDFNDTKFNKISVDVSDKDLKKGDKSTVTVSGVGGESVLFYSIKKKVTVTFPSWVKSELNKDSVKSSDGSAEIDKDSIQMQDNRFTFEITPKKKTFKIDDFKFECESTSNDDTKGSITVNVSDSTGMSATAETEITNSKKEEQTDPGKDDDKKDDSGNTDKPDKDDGGNTGDNTGGNTSDNTGGNSGGNSGSSDSGKEVISITPGKKKTTSDTSKKKSPVKKIIDTITKPDIIDNVGMKTVDNLLNLGLDQKTDNDSKKKNTLVNTSLPLHLSADDDDIVAYNDPSSNTADDDSNDSDDASDKTDKENDSEDSNSSGDTSDTNSDTKTNDTGLSDNDDTTANNSSKKSGLKRYLLIGGIAVIAAVILACIIGLLKKS